MISIIKEWLENLGEAINANFGSVPFDRCKLGMIRVKVNVNNKKPTK